MAIIRAPNWWVVEIMHTRFLTGMQKVGSDRFYSCINLLKPTGYMMHQ